MLAAELLAAADLWLFVTSAARYADQVPWDFLQAAAERSTAVAVVLDRTPPDAVEEVSGHLARMLTARGLRDSPLFTVTEGAVDDDGLLPRGRRREIRAWLDSLAADSERPRRGREADARRRGPLACRAAPTTSPTPRPSRSRWPDRLREDVDRAYDEAIARIDDASADGTLLRGEVLARWQEFVGTGELLRSLETKVGRLRDRVVGWVRGKPQQAERVTVAVESGLETLILEHAETAAERAEASWRSVTAGQHLLEDSGRDLGRASRDFRVRAERVGPRLAARRARDGPHRGRRQADDRTLPGLRRQRPVGRADGRRLRAHRRRLPAPRSASPAAARVRRPEAARGGLRRPGRAPARRGRPAPTCNAPGHRADGRRAGPLPRRARRARHRRGRRRAAARGRPGASTTSLRRQGPTRRARAGRPA